MGRYPPILFLLGVDSKINLLGDESILENIKIVNGNDLTEPSSMHIDTNIDNTDSSPMYAANNIPTPIKMKSSIVENDDSPIETPIDFKKNIIIKKI